eukprot:2560946-Alexandrium_andersonii.AAC.1
MCASRRQLELSRALLGQRLLRSRKRAAALDHVSRYFEAVPCLPPPRSPQKVARPIRTQATPKMHIWRAPDAPEAPFGGGGFPEGCGVGRETLGGEW